MSTYLVRPAAVAGVFYPADAAALREWVESALRRACERRPPPTVRPKAVVAPHAGYVYSGDVAAVAYAALRDAPGAAPVERVVLLGPAHTAPLRSVAGSGADAFATPLGLVRTDTAGRDALVAAGLASVDDAAHAGEHALEVHLPFVQVALGDVPVLPLLVGAAPPGAVEAALDHVWSEPGTVVVVSTDLSHYHAHATAQALDRLSAEAILACRGDLLDPDAACGVRPLRGLLAFAARRSLRIELLDLRNSGDTAGTRERVVGYGAFTLT